MSSEPEGERPKMTRAPRYKVFELSEAFTPNDVHDMLMDFAKRCGVDEAKAGPNADYVLDENMPVALNGWFQIGDEVAGATDRKAITSIVGTPEEPAEGFDADRRLLPHAAVLVGQWHERRLKREVHKPTKEEAEKLKALLDGTVTEEWES